MGSNRQFERQSLFTRYAANLSLHLPNVTNSFLCPLCKLKFSQSALDCSPPAISIAHIIPQSVGGSLHTLTCTECNNKAGSLYESQLAKERIIPDVKAGKGTLPATLKTHNCQIAVDLSYQDSKLLIRHSPDRSNPTSSSKIFKEAQENWSNFTFTVTHDLPSSKKRNIALLHSAFLMMFYYLGYEYILSENAESTRVLIQDHTRWTPAHDHTIVTVKAASDMPTEQSNLSLIVAPSELRCFFVVLPPPDSTTLARGVLLPGFSTDGKESYDRILKGNWQLTDFRFTQIPYCPAYLTSPIHKSFGRDVWQSV